VSPPNRRSAAQNIWPGSTPVGQFGDEAFQPAGLGVKILGADVEHATLAAHFQKFRTGHVFRNIRTRQTVHLEITIVAEGDPPLRIGHYYALVEVVQGGTDKAVSAQLRPSDLAQRRMDPERDSGEKRADDNAADQ
jgi:hypothetical protein